MENQLHENTSKNFLFNGCIQPCCRVIVDFEGTATHFGKICGTFNFCAGGPDDPDVEGPDQAYEGGVTTFTGKINLIKGKK